MPMTCKRLKLSSKNKNEVKEIIAYIKSFKGFVFFKPIPYSFYFSF